MAEAKTFRIDIVTPERILFSDDATFAVFPATEGEIGVLPFHASLITSLQPGEIKIERKGKVDFLAISGGMLEVLSNKASVLAETAEFASEIDVDRARRSQSLAMKLMENEKATAQYRQGAAQYRRAAARLRVAERAAPAPDTGATTQSSPV
jgi:F-type H+-transporting ATPase subunit epsilon